MTHPTVDSQITFFYTHDLTQTARFYEEIIGMHLKLDQGDVPDISAHSE